MSDVSVSTPTITQPSPGPVGHDADAQPYRDRPEDRESANAKARAKADPVADAGTASDAPPKAPTPIDQGGPTHATQPERGPDGKFLAKEGAAPKAEPTPSLAEAAAEAGAQAAGIAPPAPPPQKWKLGDTEFTSPDELAKAAERLQLERDQARAYQRYVEEAAQREQKARLFEQRMKADPLAALREMGHDPRELALQEVRRAMEEEKRFAGMTPEQIEYAKRLESAEARAQQVQQAWDAEKQQRQTQALKLFQEAKAQEFIFKINKAFELNPDLPRTSEVQARLIAEMKRNLRARYDIPPELLARKVQQDLEREHSTWDTDERFDAQAYMKKYPSRVEKLRAAWVAEMQKGQPTGNPAQAAGITPLSSQPMPKAEKRQQLLTPEEARVLINKRING